MASRSIWRDSTCRLQPIRSTVASALASAFTLVQNPAPRYTPPIGRSFVQFSSFSAETWERPHVSLSKTYRCRPFLQSVPHIRTCYMPAERHGHTPYSPASLLIFVQCIVFSFAGNESPGICYYMFQGRHFDLPSTGWCNKPGSSAFTACSPDHRLSLSKLTHSWGREKSARGRRVDEPQLNVTSEMSPRHITPWRRISKQWSGVARGIQLNAYRRLTPNAPGESLTCVQPVDVIRFIRIVGRRLRLVDEMSDPFLTKSVDASQQSHMIEGQYRKSSATLPPENRPSKV